jgi:hypothetical protein
MADGYNVLRDMEILRKRFWHAMERAATLGVQTERLIALTRHTLHASRNCRQVAGLLRILARERRRRVAVR